MRILSPTLLLAASTFVLAAQPSVAMEECNEVVPSYVQRSATNTIRQNPLEAEGYCELVAYICSQLNGTKSLSRRVQHSLWGLEEFVNHKDSPRKLRLRFAAELADFYASSNKNVQDLGKSLQFSEMVVEDKKGYHIAMVFDVLDRVMKMNQTNQRQLKKAFDLRHQYALRYPGKTRVLQTYSTYLSRLNGLHATHQIHPLDRKRFQALKSLDEYVNVNPSATGYLTLARSYEKVYGLVGPNCLLTRVAYFSACKMGSDEAWTYVYRNPEVFFPGDRFAPYMFHKEMIAQGKQETRYNSRTERWEYVDQFKEFLEGEGTEESRILLLCREGVTEEDLKKLEAGTYGRFIAEGLYAASLPGDSELDASIKELTGKIELHKKVLENPTEFRDYGRKHGTRLGKEGPWLYFGPSVRTPYEYFSSQYRSETVAGVKEALESYQAEKNEKQAQLGLRTKLLEKRKVLLKGLEAEELYQKTALYRALLHEGTKVPLAALQDYKLILEALVSRNHLKGVQDMIALSKYIIKHRIALLNNKFDVNREKAELASLIRREKAIVKQTSKA